MVVVDILSQESIVDRGTPGQDNKRRILLGTRSCVYSSNNEMYYLMSSL